MLAYRFAYLCPTSKIGAYRRIKLVQENSRQSFGQLRSQTRLTAGLGLFAMLVLQIANAGHQFEHVADDATQACRICAQQDRQDDSLPVAEVAGEWQTHVDTPAVTLAHATAPIFLPVRKARGPPRTS